MGIEIQNVMAVVMMDLVQLGRGHHFSCLKIMQQQAGAPEMKRKVSKYPHQGGKTVCSAYGQTKFMTTNPMKKMKSIPSR